MTVSSSVILNQNKNPRISRMALALARMQEQIDTEVKGQFKQTVVIRSGNVTISNDELDCEFTTAFDDNTQADEAEITIYNLTNNTINGFVNKARITITAGYANDTGIIFDGYITKKKTYRDGVDRVTVIRALDDSNRYNQSVQSISYAAGTKASYILKDLCGRVGLPIAVFKTAKDYTFTDAVTVDGGLSEAIKKYAQECGVSAYVCKQKLYVRPLNDGDATKFRLSSDTGLLSVSEFEEEVQTESGSETVKGFDVEMLLQYRLQTASIIELDSVNYKGTFRVREGSHAYSGSEFKTTAKIVAYSPISYPTNVTQSGSAAQPTDSYILVDSEDYILMDSEGYILTDGGV